MKRKIALITGITGQDGAYLSNFLLKKNYKVIGIGKNYLKNNWRLKKLGISNKITFEKGSVTQSRDIKRIFKKYKIDEVYNLAAQSSVKKSFKNPYYTAYSTGLSVLKLLEFIRLRKKKVKFYQASSSEMIGNVKKNLQNENANFNPQSPYAISKLFGHHITKYYRNSYNIFAVSGILFNHESPLRSNEFVTKKIIIGLIEIQFNKKRNIELGNIYSKRDWGYAKEYVEQMWNITNQKIPQDLVIATGKAYSIKDFINEVCKNLKIETRWVGKGINEKLINIKNKNIIIKINKKLFRPSELHYVRGDISKARKILNWKPKVNFKKLVKIMVEDELENQKN